jgi:hypothetical protein
MTRAETLRYGVAFALFKLRIPDRRERLLTEDERFAVADHVMESLRQYRDAAKFQTDSVPMGGKNI